VAQLKKAIKYVVPKQGNLGKIHGGKQYLTRQLLELYPALESITGHVEECGGLASMTFNLPTPVKKVTPRFEVYNDIDGRVCNLFRMCRNYPEQLTLRLNLTPYSLEEFERAKDPNVWAAAASDPLEQARLTYVLHQMSFGGQGVSWSWTKNRTRRGISDVVAGHLGTIDDQLPGIIARLREWQFEQLDVILCFLKYDDTSVMHYLDPPYIPETRAADSRKIYANEMTIEQHEELLCCLTGRASKWSLAKVVARYPKPKGFVMISGYDHEMYNDYLKGWRKVVIKIANHAAGGKEKRRMEECVWMNYTTEVE
jgi:DNA adenine methylase